MEKWCKVSKKADSWFQIWDEEFGEVSPNYSKIQNFDAFNENSGILYFDRILLSEVYKDLYEKEQKSYVSLY